MAKKWTADAALVDSLSENMVEVLPLLPKRMLRIDAIVREHKMPFSHIQILTMLKEGSVSIGELSDKLSIAKPNITPLVDMLAAQGYVERIRDERDRRVVIVSIKDAGMAKLEEIRQSICDQICAWNASFSRSEIKELNNALATLIRIVKGIGDIDI